MSASPPTSDALACPRCPSASLHAGGGSALLDSPCWSCGGTFVPSAGVARLIHDEHGIDIQTLRELMGRYAGTRMPCPGCSYAMSHVQLKGVPMELCTGCGSAWLDADELNQLSRGRYTYEVPAAPEAPPKPVEVVLPRAIPVQPVDAVFEPSAPRKLSGRRKDITGRHGGTRPSGARVGCGQVVGAVYAGGFGLFMGAVGLFLGEWQFVGLGAVALALAGFVLVGETLAGPRRTRTLSSPGPSALPPETPSGRS